MEITIGETNDWPAWVQAIGSILAIAAAIWIDRGAARRLRVQARSAQADLYQVIWHLALEAMAGMKAVESAFRGERDMVHPDEIKGVIDALDAFRLDRLSGDVALALLRFRRGLRSTARDHDELWNWRERHGGLPLEYKKRMDLIGRRTRHTLAELKVAIQTDLDRLNAENSRDRFPFQS